MERHMEGFLTQLASSAPVPGGGGAAALCGAVGIALGNMVGSLTLGKSRYADVQKDIAVLNERAEALRSDFLTLIDQDAAAFEPLSIAYSIPKSSPKRSEIMETALKRAAEPPLDIMRKCGEALEVIAAYAKKGSSMAISDAGCAAVLSLAAMRAAALNVRINTKSMTDHCAAEKINAEADGLLAEYEKLGEEIYKSIYWRLA